MNALVYVDIDQGINKGKKLHEIKNGKSYFGFSYTVLPPNSLFLGPGIFRELQIRELEI